MYSLAKDTSYPIVLWKHQSLSLWCIQFSYFLTLSTNKVLLIHLLRSTSFMKHVPNLPSHFHFHLNHLGIPIIHITKKYIMVFNSLLLVFLSWLWLWTFLLTRIFKYLKSKDRAIYHICAISSILCGASKEPMLSKQLLILLFIWRVIKIMFFCSNVSKDSSRDVTDSSGLGLERWSLGLMRTKGILATHHMCTGYVRDQWTFRKRTWFKQTKWSHTLCSTLGTAGVKPAVCGWRGGEDSVVWPYGMHHQKCSLFSNSSQASSRPRAGPGLE